MTYLIRIFSVLLLGIFILTMSSHGQKLENPITADYLKKHLAKKSPKLILTPTIEKRIKKKLKSDSYVQAYYKNMLSQSAEIIKKPLLKRELE